MAIAAEILSKVSDIVRTELSKRLPESIRVHRVVAQALQHRAVQAPARKYPSSQSGCAGSAGR